MKKIKLLSLLLCLTLCCLIVFTACVNTPDDDDDDDPNAFTVIRFWNGFTGVDGEAMDKIVADFNRDVAPQYNMTVAVDKLPWDTLFTKITTTSSNLKSAPHIVAMSASRIAGMQAKGVLTPLTGIETYLDVSEDDYISAAWNGGILPNGERYGFPIDVHPTAMYYNKDLISEDELPTTWEEFVQVCQEKTKNGVYGWAVPSMYSISKDVFLNMLYTSGGSVFYSPRRNETQLLWFKSGYIEYRFPNGPSSNKIGSIAFSLECCSEAPGYRVDFPSDITFWINNNEICTWKCPGDFGGKRGSLTPSWWPINSTQYGLLKTLSVTNNGSFLDGICVSDINLTTLNLCTNDYISLKIGIKKDSANVGGINIFGEQFGNHAQNILMTIEYDNC